MSVFEVEHGAGAGAPIESSSAYAGELPSAQSGDAAHAPAPGPAISTRIYNGLASAANAASTHVYNGAASAATAVRNVVTHPAFYYPVGGAAIVVGAGAMAVYGTKAIHTHGYDNGFHDGLTAYPQLHPPAVKSAPAPAPPPDPRISIEGPLRGRTKRGFDYVDNGNVHIERSLYGNYTAARQYLGLSKHYDDFLKELEANHEINVQPRPIDDYGAAEFDFMGARGNTTWDPAVGRRAQQPRTEEHLARCEDQSPAVKLQSDLYNHYGVTMHPTEVRIGRCVPDLYHENQENVRINEKINEGIGPLGELPSAVRGPEVDVRNVTAHEPCRVSGTSLVDITARKNPVLNNENVLSCSAVTNRGFDAIDFETPNGVSDNRISLTHGDIAALTHIVQKAEDLGFRAAEAARENGTSPFVFERENDAVRNQTRALIQSVQVRADVAPDPFFDPGVPSQGRKSLAPAQAPDIAIDASGAQVHGVGHADVLVEPKRLAKPAPAPEPSIHVPFPIGR